MSNRADRCGEKRDSSKRLWESRRRDPTNSTRSTGVPVAYTYAPTSVNWSSPSQDPWTVPLVAGLVRVASMPPTRSSRGWTMRPYRALPPMTLDWSTKGVPVRELTLEPASLRFKNPMADSRPIRARAWPNVWVQSVA